ALREGPGGVLEIALQRDGIHTFEALILARYQMNTQVYHHRVRRIYDEYLRRYFAACDPAEFDTVEKLLAHNDVTLMARILHDTEGVRGIWAALIRERKHHRLIHETGESASAMDLRRSAELLDRLRQRYPEVDFHRDQASVSIHNL